MTTSHLATPADRIQQDGFLVHDSALVPDELVDAARDRVSAVLAGEYDLGRPPLNAKGLDDPHALKKIDNAHSSDAALAAVVTHPSVGRLAAAAMGADWVQLWASQLLVKPPSKGSPGAVGWHQDQNYWVDLWEGEVFTLWLALDAVDADMGPLRFVKGSHRWGHRTDGDFFSQDLDSGRARMTPGGETWSEVPALLPAGGASVHHKLTVHGSTQNTSQRTRYGMALHLRTDRSNPVAGVEDPLVALASDESLSPVLYGAA